MSIAARPATGYAAALKNVTEDLPQVKLAGAHNASAVPSEEGARQVSAGLAPARRTPPAGLGEALRDMGFETVADVRAELALDVLGNLAAGGDHEAMRYLSDALVDRSFGVALQTLTDRMVSERDQGGEWGEFVDSGDVLLAASHKCQRLKVCEVPASSAAAVAAQLKQMPADGVSALLLHVEQHFMTAVVEKVGGAVVQVHLFDSNAVDKQQGADETSKLAASRDRRQACDWLEQAGVQGAQWVEHAQPLQHRAGNSCGLFAVGLIRHLEANFPGEGGVRPLGASIQAFMQSKQSMSDADLRRELMALRNEIALVWTPYRESLSPSP